MTDIKTNRDKLKENVLELLSNKYFNGIGIVIKGQWGSGKSYFWKNEIANVNKDGKDKEKTFANISLFKVGTVSEIQREIILQLSKSTKFIDSIKKYTGNFQGIIKSGSKIFGLDFSALPFDALLSLFEKKDFKNITICFDDFERMPEKLSLKEVLGYISYLKEDKECNVVMILNEDYLSKLENDSNDAKNYSNNTNAKIWMEYKEKVVDFEFEFSPSHDENLSNIMKTFEENKAIKMLNKSQLLPFIEEYKCKNMRIMRRAILSIIRFEFVVAMEIEQELKINIFLNILNESLKLLCNENPIVFGYDMTGFTILPTPINHHIKMCITEGKLDTQLFIETIKEHNERYRQSDSIINIYQEFTRYAVDNVEQFIERLKTLFQQDYITPPDMAEIIWLLSEYDPTNDLSDYYNKFENKLHTSINKMIENNKGFFSIHLENFRGKCKSNEKLLQILEKTVTEENENHITKTKESKDSIIKLLKKIIAEHSFNEIDKEILQSITPNEWKKLLLDKELEIAELKSIYNISSSTQENIDMMLKELVQGNKFMKFKFKLKGFNFDEEV
ncbi:KAP family P-loop domain-containing protein [Desulfonema limicola]|uniref:KAP family P-loop domain-containing protein n=1 Tax=Desulfonema limicola TaxID=45656 RepID=A0A975BCA7_9BACT|nr:P-loop NTPase fold protein [Desulfonema limicola]QTA82716.1 KAP family P-loop domain-containing protein [Desulfonema limicola]